MLIGARFRDEVLLSSSLPRAHWGHMQAGVQREGSRNASVRPTRESRSSAQTVAVTDEAELREEAVQRLVFERVQVPVRI